MRIPPGKGSRQSAPFQKPRCLRVCVMPGHPAVSQAFPNAVTQCAAWVKGICRCLKNHLHFPIDHTEWFPRFPRNVLAIQKNLSFCRIQKPRDQIHRRCLSAAAFADDTEAFAGQQVKADAIYSGQIALSAAGKGFCQILNAQNRLHLTPSLTAARQTAACAYSLPADHAEPSAFLRTLRFFHPA